MTWALPLYRAFGISVRLHLFFLFITVPLCLRQINKYGDFIAWYDIAGLTLGVLFLNILLHEYGHCFAARWVGGTADEILIWPLGGLAFCSPPHTWRANLITTLGGPGTNLLICVVCGVALAGAGYAPPLNPLADPYAANMYNFRDGRTHGSVYAANVYRANTAEAVSAAALALGKTANVPQSQEVLGRAGYEWAVAPTWAVWVWRMAWMSWVLFLFNMLIFGYPMDCGRVVQAVLWARSGDYRQSTMTACYAGYVAGFVLFAVALFREDVMLSGLSFFILVSCFQTLQAEANAEAGAFGYDFSQGYTSLERDDPPPPRPKRPGLVKGWLAARKAKKLARAAQEKARDDERMDQLLDKIQRAGKLSLTDEERRFMERVSARYRNRS